MKKNIRVIDSFINLKKSIIYLFIFYEIIYL